jgi:hypothetical protein
MHLFMQSGTQTPPLAGVPMSDPTPVTALRVGNEGFLVSSTIDRCPKTMMIREFVVNAVEAASRANAA